MKAEIIETIRESLKLGKKEIVENSKIEDLIQDSLDLVELVAVLSNKYKIVIHTSELQNIVTVGDIINYVEKHKNTKFGKSAF